MSDVVEGEKHFTASVWIISKGQPKKALLLHHRKHDKWLQPGGHIEKFENPVEAAIREVKEETGVDVSFLADKIEKLNVEASFLPIPRYLMEQVIPAHGDEPAHFHLDMQYVAEIEEQELLHNIRESHGIGWFTLEEVLKLPIYKDTGIILGKLLR
jgi:8-oxo-dGTP pyrophosphatase MutT (NUDIX family)